jgi:hypothetical protein
MRLDASYNLCSKFGSKLFFFRGRNYGNFIFSFARPFLDFESLFLSGVFLKVEPDKIYAMLDMACMHMPSSYGTRSPLKNIRARGRIIFLFFSRTAGALKIRQINSAILKVPDAAWSC